MKYDEKKYIKKEPVVLKKKYLNLFKALNKKKLALDERIFKQLGKKIGFKSSDQKVFKLISAYLEMQINEILTSINHKNKKEIDIITKKYQEAKDDTKMSKKKFANLHKMIMENRVLSQKELIGELLDRDDFNNQTSIIPVSMFDNTDSENEQNSEQ